MKIILKNQISEITRLGEELDKFGIENSIKKELINTINFVLDEVVTNVIMYAYPKDELNFIEIDIDIIDEYIVMKVIDSGKKFDPTQIKDPDISKDLTEREIGGLGIYLVKNSVDKIEYEYIDNKNVLTIYKKYK